MDAREKLIDILKQAPFEGKVLDEWWWEEKIKMIADHLIASGVTVQEWISVKDRLPDPYEKVLVRLDHWAGVDTYLAFYDTERGWCDFGGYFDDGTNNDGEPLTYETAGVNVTHWMPLPEPPKES